MSQRLQSSASRIGTKNAVGFVIDITAPPYNADKTGASDAAPAFNLFRTNFNGTTSSVSVTIPGGTYDFDTSAQNCTKNVYNLKFNGAGIDVTFMNRQQNTNGAAFKWGSEGLFQDALHSAKINTVAIGATSATLTTADAGKIGRFSANQRCIIAGIDLQGSGDPFNNHFFEYLKILSIAGTTITFTSATKNAYKSTWPAYNDGTVSGAGMDQAGAATLYALDPSSDCDFIMQDMTFDILPDKGVSDDGPIGYVGGRNATMKNIKLAAFYGWSPSVAETVSYVTCNMSRQIEVDKSVGTFNVQGGYIQKLLFQSSSVGLLNISDGAQIDQIAGTPRKVIINDSTINQFQMGPGYGVTESVECNNSTLVTFENSAATYNIATEGYTCAGGIIQQTINPTRRDLQAIKWAVPGCWIYFSGTNGWLASAKVLDVYRDSTITYVQTTLPGGFPTSATLINGHPCAKWIGVANSGCPEADDHSFTAAQSKPIFSYTWRQYTKSLLPSPTGVPRSKVWGAIVAINITVYTPYSGTGTLIWSYDQFHNSSNIIRADNTTLLLCDIRIDAKVGGARTFTPTGNTFSGGAKPANDVWPTLAVGDRFCKLPNTGPTLSVDVSGSADPGPVIVMEIICDQGIT